MKRSCKQIFARGTNWFLVALLSIALVVTGLSCGGQTEVNYVFDDLGRLVAINGTPQRIVSLAPSNTEILFALGLGGKVIGVTDYCDYPPEALDKEKVGGYATPDVERIAALNPDLVLAGYGNPREVVYTLAGLGLTVYGIKTTDLDDLLNDIRRIGEITDKEVEAANITSQMASTIEAITNVTSGLTERPRTFYLIWGGEGSPLWTAGSETFIHELIEKAGGMNICQNITGYTTVSIEEVIARDPEVIITSIWCYDWALNASELEGTTARQTGRVFTCNDDLVQRPGPRLVKGLEWFAHFVHPEIFEEPEGS